LTSTALLARGIVASVVPVIAFKKEKRYSKSETTK